jgi:peptide/nickel transport system substrate-binding protein
MRHRAIGIAVALTAFAGACGPGSDRAPEGSQSVLRVAPIYDLESLDPFWTFSFAVRDHGFLIYDTLFGMDAQGRIRPQMVDTYQVSADRKTWTFTLRDGLEFHDGTPVTSSDVIASLERWGQGDTMGQRHLSFVEQWRAIDSYQSDQCVLLAWSPVGLALRRGT